MSDEIVTGGAMAPRQIAELPIGPRIRKSPFFEATQRAGFRVYTVYNHMYLPAYYRSVQEDLEWLVSAVTLWDVACERQVEISGPDAAAFTQYLCPRDLSRCPPGHCRYVFMCDANGGILNDPLLLRLAEDRFWLSIADSDILLWAQGIASQGSWDVEIREPDVSPLALQGPRSADVMCDLLGADMAALPFFRCREADLDGIPLVVSRSGWSGEDGFEIYLCDGQYGDALWDKIMAAGIPHDIAPGAPNAINRIEAGLLSYGGDMTQADNPIDMGLDAFIDLDIDADFIGKKALLDIRARGPRAVFTGLEFSGPPISVNEHPWACRDGDAVIGRVTAAAYSPRLHINMGMAHLDIAYGAVGTEIEVDTGSGVLTARVRPLPFYSRRG